MRGMMSKLHTCMAPNVYTQVPDGGWGWAVAVAFFFVEVFTYGIIKVFGIFLLDLTNTFKESYSRVCWIVSICVFVMTFTAPVSSMLSKRFGFRPVVMVGGFLISLGTITSAFTTSVTQMYITVGLVTGLGYCLTFLPTVTILSQYFHKRRSLVTSVASTGECVAIFVLAPALSALKEQVGWRSCMVFIGVLQASVIGFGALLRPIIIQPAPPTPDDKEAQESPLKGGGEYEVENELTRTSLDSVDSGVQSISSKQITAFSEIPPPDQEDSDPPAPSLPQDQKAGFRKRVGSALQFSQLRDLGFISYCLFGLFATLGFFAPQLYVIELSVAYGVPRESATYMLSVMAGAEICGRLGVGWVMNRGWVRKLYILLGCVTLLSAVLALFPVLSLNFWTLASCCAACGFLFGTVGSTHIPMLAESDVLGVDRMTMGAGVYVCIQSFAGLAGPPLAGVLLDHTQNYGSPFYFSAGGVFLGAVFLALVRPAKTGFSCCRRNTEHIKDEQEVPPDDFLEVDMILENDDVTKDSTPV